MKENLTLAEKAKSLLDKSRTILVLALIIPIILWTIVPIRNYLFKANIFDSDTIQSIQMIAIVIVITSYAQLSQSFKNVIEKMNFLHSDMLSLPLEGGANKIYEKLVILTSDIENKSQKKIDVLGLNLALAWPMVKSWVRNEKHHDWEINLYGLSPEFIEKNSDALKSNWEKLIKSNCDDIVSFKQENYDFFKENRIEINLRLYSSFPAVHGFSLATGDVFFTACQWDKEGKFLDGTVEYYEQILAANNSARARFYRTLMSNWIKRAKSTSVDYLNGEESKNSK